MAVIYFITSTDGTEVFQIPPGTLNGPKGITANTDLRLYGEGSVEWGEGINENFYRLLENFACPPKPSDPNVPQDETDLGPGLGINNPVRGQLWFNTDVNLLYVYTGSQWLPAGGVISGPTPPPSPIIGMLWYNTTIPQLMVWNGSAWESVAERYLLLAGGTMEPGANIQMQGGGEVLGLPSVPSDPTAATSKDYVDTTIATTVAQYVPLAGTLPGLEVTGRITFASDQKFSIGTYSSTGDDFFIAAGIDDPKYGAPDDNRYKTSGDGAAITTFNVTGSDGQIGLHVATVGNAGDPISWRSLRVQPDRVDFDLLPAKNAGAPVDPNDLTTKDYVDTTKVDVTGDTMTGVLNLSFVEPTIVLDNQASGLLGQAALRNKQGDTFEVEFRDSSGNYIDTPLIVRSGAPILAGNGTGWTINGKVVWHAGNDGHTSGLDADLLDGYHYSDIINNTIGTIGPGTFKRVDVYTSPGTYTWTKPSQTNGVFVLIQGAGGGSGTGARNHRYECSADYICISGSGQPSCWVFAYIPGSALNVTENVVVGNGGAGATTVAVVDAHSCPCASYATQIGLYAGGPGESTSFGSHIIVPGGGGSRMYCFAVTSSYFGTPSYLSPEIRVSEEGTYTIIPGGNSPRWITLYGPPLEFKIPLYSTSAQQIFLNTSQLFRHLPFNFKSYNKTDPETAYGLPGRPPYLDYAASVPGDAEFAGYTCIVGPRYTPGRHNGRNGFVIIFTF